MSPYRRNATVLLKGDVVRLPKSKCTEPFLDLLSNQTLLLYDNKQLKLPHGSKRFYACQQATEISKSNLHLVYIVTEDGKINWFCPSFLKVHENQN